MRNRLLHHKSLAFLQCCLSVRRSSNGYRCFNSVSTNPVMDDCCDDPVVVEGNGCSRTALLNRPSSLNAINKDMAVRLQKLYKDWEDDHDVRFVVLKGRGRAFCAGGDLISLYNLMKQGNIEESKQIFWNGYGLIYLIASYVKPHVAILNGITMGGGAGISIPGTFRVATDKTLFATPEVLIGFHPDAGASYYLSRLPGYLGEYLAMTGDKLNGSEMISCGLATHYTHTTKLPMVERALGNLVTSDHYLVGASLQKFQDPVHIHHNSLIHKMETVDKCFSHDTVEEIIESLENEAAQKNDQWCASTLRKLKEAAPLSLKVSLRSIREGRTQTLEQCLTREYRMTIQAMSKQITTDFYEGIRAKLVDEDVVPKWDPPTLEHVSQDMVNQYFSDLSPLAQELELPKLII